MASIVTIFRAVIDVGVALYASLDDVELKLELMLDPSVTARSRH
jgi:hypothetical protein